MKGQKEKIKRKKDMGYRFDDLPSERKRKTSKRRAQKVETFIIQAGEQQNLLHEIKKSSTFFFFFQFLCFGDHKEGLTPL